MLHVCNLLLRRAWIERLYTNRQKIVQIGLLAGLKFLITYIFCILEALKTTSLVMSSSLAESIYVVRVFLSFPVSFLVLMLYTRLSNHIKLEKLFYIFVIFFLLSLFVYGFILYPNEDKIRPVSFIYKVNQLYPGLSIYTSVLQSWIHAFFFVISELWGQIVLAVMYWGFVNSIYRINQAKRYYSIFITAGHIGTLLAGLFVKYRTGKYLNLDFGFTLQYLIKQILGLGILVLLFYWLVNRQLGDGSNEAGTGVRHTDKTIRLSFLQSLKYVCTSSYLRNIAVIVVACGFSVGIVDGTWKSYLKTYCHGLSEYQLLTSNTILWRGIISLVISLFLSKPIIMRWGWGWAAGMAPAVMGTCGCTFFLMSYVNHHVPIVGNLLGEKLLWYIVCTGGLYAIASKAVKYDFFDQTTQIAYIPLNPEEKIKGKAAIDVLGSRLGKAGCSWIQLILLSAYQTDSIQVCSGFLFIVLLSIAVLWCRSVHNINQKIRGFEDRAGES